MSFFDTNNIITKMVEIKHFNKLMHNFQFLGHQRKIFQTETNKYSMLDYRIKPITK